MINCKVLKTLMFGTDYKVMLACMILIVKIVTEDKMKLKKKPLMFGEVNEDGLLQLAEQPSINNMLRRYI